MEVYLNESIKNLFYNYEDPVSDLNEDYLFMQKKTLELFQYIEPIHRHSTFFIKKICIAACFWIIHKFYDDFNYTNTQIRSSFNLGTIRIKTLNLWEVEILKYIKWKV